MLKTYKQQWENERICINIRDLEGSLMTSKVTDLLFKGKKYVPCRFEKSEVSAYSPKSNIDLGGISL